MVTWALASLPFVDLPTRPAITTFKVLPKDLIFISRTDHEELFAITEKLRALFSQQIHIVLLPKITRGAVETALAAKRYINYNEELIISDCDHYFNGNNFYQAILEKDNATQGIIPVFKPADTEPKWSYTLFDNTLTALAVGEKDPVLAAKGAYANIGAYYFRSGRLFVEEAEKMIKENDMYGAPGKQEFYVAPLYQRLIRKGLIVKTSIIPKVWGLGTPKDVALFLKSKTAFP